MRSRLFKKRTERRYAVSENAWGTPWLSACPRCPPHDRRLLMIRKSHPYTIYIDYCSVERRLADTLRTVSVLNLSLHRWPQHVESLFYFPPPPPRVSSIVASLPRHRTAWRHSFIRLYDIRLELAVLVYAVSTRRLNKKQSNKWAWWCFWLSLENMAICYDRGRQGALYGLIH